MKLQNVITDNGELYGVQFFCPGCQMLQTIPTESVAGNILWRFNGDRLAPTIRPNLRTHWGHGGRLTLCDACITDSAITFEANCTHALAGQTVELPELEEVI